MTCEDIVLVFMPEFHCLNLLIEIQPHCLLHKISLRTKLGVKLQPGEKKSH